MDRNEIQKALNTLEIAHIEGVIDKETIEKARVQSDELLKGGEGSRGGKVIGHTKSGKPIYEEHNHPEHKDFTVHEHLDAAEIHRKKSRESYDKWQESKNKRAEERGENERHNPSKEEKENEETLWKEYVNHSSKEHQHNKKAKKIAKVHSSHNINLRNRV